LTYLDLDLVPPVLIRTLGDELSPPGTVVGSISRVIPINTQYVQILLQCVLPCPLWSSDPATLWSPYYGQTSLAGLVVGSRRMCPTNRLRRVATVSCSAACPVYAITSSFVMW